MNFMDMVTKKQDGRRGFNAYFQQGYLKNNYIFSFWNKLYIYCTCNVKSVKPTKKNDIV